MLKSKVKFSIVKHVSALVGVGAGGALAAVRAKAFRAPFLVFFLFSCSSPESAFAPTPVEAEIKVELIMVRGHHGLTHAQVLDLWAELEERFETELNKELNLLRLDIIDNPCEWDVQLYPYWISNLECLKKHAAATGRTYYDVLYLYILPPLIDSADRWYFGGVAAGTCRYANKIRRSGSSTVAYANGGPFNALGVPRLEMSEMIMAHELGHLIGAYHDPEMPPTVMHPTAGLFIDEPGRLYYSQQSRNQIEGCIQRRIRKLREKVRKCVRVLRRPRRSCRRTVGKRERFRFRIRRIG